MATPRSSGFNGAAAAQPRNPAAVQHTSTNCDRASMGPRLRSRGIMSGPHGATLPRCFNGAAAAQPRNHPLITETDAHGCAASMGPRLRSRGIDLVDRVSIEVREASMGPRLRSRGIGRDSCGHREIAQGFNGAAAAQPRNHLSTSLRIKAYCSLQWGRGCAAAESNRARPYSCSPARFNGAAAAQPRNHLRDGLVRFRVDSASMGPRLRSRGITR